MIRRLILSWIWATPLVLALGMWHVGQSSAANHSAEVRQDARQLLGEAESAGVEELRKAVARVRPLLDRYGYPAVFVAVGIEGAGIPAPGETLLIAGALDAVAGSLDITALVVVAVVAATLGNSAGYLIGRAGGRPLLRRLPISDARLARIDRLFERYGGALIAFARFFDGPRQLNGIVAGTLAMPWWHFTLWNVLGALLWVGVWGLGTYWLDRDIGRIVVLLKAIGPWVVVPAIGAVLAALAYLLWHRRPARAR